jgi:hypothetical protein
MLSADQSPCLLDSAHSRGRCRDTVRSLLLRLWSVAGGQDGRAGLSANTVRAYRADVATFAAYLVGVDRSDRTAATRLRVGQLTPEAVTDALSAIRRAGAADKTRARLHGTLAGLFSYLTQQGHLDTDPLVAAGLQRPRVGARLPRYIDKPSEFAEVIQAAARPDAAARTPWPERELALAFSSREPPLGQARSAPSRFAMSSWTVTRRTCACSARAA